MPYTDTPNPDANADRIEADTGQKFDRQDAGSLFPKPVPIFGEDPNAYDEFHRRVTGDVVPKGAVEELWVKDMVDLALEADRFRRMKHALLMNAAATILRRRLQDAGDTTSHKALTEDQAVSLVSRCQSGDNDALAEVTTMLAEGSQGFNAVMAEALDATLPQIETIARLIASADARRSKAFSQMDRRRKDHAARVRAVVPPVNEERIKRPPSGGYA